MLEQEERASTILSDLRIEPFFILLHLNLYQAQPEPRTRTIRGGSIRYSILEYPKMNEGSYTNYVIS